jgi:translation initiation factor IF-2
MSEAAAIRLNKVLKEIGVGIDHVVDFLDKKGVKVEKNPNAKISMEAYDLLLKEFQSDKQAKKSAEEITTQKLRKDNLVIEAKTAAATASTEPEPEQNDEALTRELIQIKQTAADKTKPAAKTKAKKAEPEPEVIKAKVEKAQPKVIDKIDLTALEKPKKKTAKKKIEEEPEPEEKPSAKNGKSKANIEPEPEVVDTPPVVEQTPEPEPPPAPPAEPEAPAMPFRMDRDKLSGPTILGKIDLPVDPPKKKSSAGSAEDNKKKRKRTEKKVNISDSSFQRPPTDKTDWGRGGGPQRGKRPAPAAKPEPTDKEIQDQIKATLARLSGSGGKTKSSKYRKEKREALRREEEQIADEQNLNKTIKVTEFVTASELAKMLNVQVTQIIATCMSLGIIVSINQRLDAETLAVVADEFGYKVEFVSADVQDAIQDKPDDPASLKPRAPIVTVMGHVDHGKTSLLDYIRKANVIAGEAGGITQHIGAYEVSLEDGRKITFLDTPGHEAFTAMRARGAKVTDVAIIVIAADDSVMPQTIEAINHAQAANVPIVFAINKIDKPGAAPERIREQLSKMNILVEDWGGKYQCQEISAKQGLNVNTLLEKVLLEAELLDLKANPDKNGVGTVIESSLDKGRGYVTTMLVQSGTLSVGDIVLAGKQAGKVKALFNERGAKMNKVGPSQPVIMLGMPGPVQAGDQFHVMDDEREAREIANKRQQLQREQGIRTHKHITLDEIGRRLAIGNFKELNVIVKGDVDGSVEALADSLLKLSTAEIQVNVIHKSVGAITETDVNLAAASNAIIIGFQVRPSLNARKLAEQEEIDIRLYSIIYDAINELKSAMEGMLAPEFEEKIVCNIEVRETFKIPKAGTIAGCMVLDGKINRNTKVRVIRDGIVAYTGELSSLRRFKDDVKEVASGYECGLSINNFNDIQVGDIIEGYEQVAVKRTLS